MLVLGDNGFVLYYKSLSEEKFKWPKRNEKFMTLTGQQINWLLDGYDISAMKGHKKLHYEAFYCQFDMMCSMKSRPQDTETQPEKPESIMAQIGCFIV